MLPGKGKGRGALIKQILEAQSTKPGSSSSDEQSSLPHSIPQTVEDSGVGQSQSHVSTSSYGRGRLFSQTSESLDAKPSTSKGSGGNGRAKLFQKIQTSSSSSGRGKLIHQILEAGDREVEQSTQIAEDVIEKMQTIKLTEAQLPQSVEPVVETKTPEAVIKRGTFGSRVNAATNYLRLSSDPNKGVFEYEVRFSPNVDAKHLRMKYLNEHRNLIGATKIFDGVTLYLPIQLQEKITILYSTNPNDQQRIEIKIIFKRKKPLRECTHLYNVLFDRVMKTLNYVRFDRKQYDPTSPKIIPQHKLEIWPGYITAVDEYEDGVMLCCDVSHRVLCQQTVLEKMKEIYVSNPQYFQENVKKALLGSIVLTRYNNKTYRIDDINFQLNPLTTFKMNDGSDISYMKYYESQYNITINDVKQPLLINMKTRRIAGKALPDELMICLIPEISYLTGLQDEMRSDYKVMKDIAAFTKVTPNQRIYALKKFYENVNNCKEASEILSNWGLKLNSNPEKLECRQYKEEDIYFASGKFPAGVNASFARYATNNELLDVVNVNNWLLIHTKNTSNAARTFLDHIQKVARPMGIQINKPLIQVLNDDRTDSYINALRHYLKPQIQIVVLICPTSRDDRYAAIKKLCCAEIPKPSQVINSKTFGMNDAKNRSIVQKIVLQMNCKLGGTLWSVKIPFKSLMICGIDSYHDAGQKGNSVSAFVASINGTFTKWYSRATIQTRKEEIVNGLCASFKMALQEYEKINNCLPSTIIVFRDGVGDGQLNLCTEYEVPQFEEACRMHNPDYNPTMAFIVVQKRINTRIFAEAGLDGYKNPDPGFVLDHTVTRKYLYDYFLVSQSVREGTVSPTHYIVVKDNTGFEADIIQRISYKLCFLYYNWPGTVRVPACCQYAHKLAYLVGQNIRRPTSETLSTKLFYL